MLVSNFDKMDSNKKKELLETADHFLQNLS